MHTNLQLDLDVIHTQSPTARQKTLASSLDKPDKLDTSKNTCAYRTPKDLTKKEENTLFIKLRDLRDDLSKERPQKTLPSSYALKVLACKTLAIFKAKDDEQLTNYRETSDVEKLQTLLHYSQLSLELNAHKDIDGKTLEESFSSNTQFTVDHARDFIRACLLRLDSC